MRQHEDRRDPHDEERDAQTDADRIARGADVVVDITNVRRERVSVTSPSCENIASAIARTTFRSARLRVVRSGNVTSIWKASWPGAKRSSQCEIIFATRRAKVQAVRSSWRRAEIPRGGRCALDSQPHEDRTQRPCHCGSGQKYKKCHLAKDDAARSAELAASAATAAAAQAKAMPTPRREDRGGRPKRRPPAATVPRPRARRMPRNATTHARPTQAPAFRRKSV